MPKGHLMKDTPFKKGFGSDNHSGVHPQILQNLLQINSSHAPSYGTDSLTKETDQIFQNLFGKEYIPYYVFNGTAANVLSLKSLMKTWQSVLCTQISHLNSDECGAPEAMGGLKLIPVPEDKYGKLTPEALSPFLTRKGDQHFSQVEVISITQPTELGTVYTHEEIQALVQFAKKHHLKIHVDGARLANAMEHLQCDFKQWLQLCPADAISFGGTKNGLLGCEAILLKDSQSQKTFKYIRKQNMQLPSKMRFIAAQFKTYFENNLYQEIAAHSRIQAQLLAKKLKPFQQIEILYPVESNAVFIKLPKPWTAPLKNNKFFYIWDPEVWSARLMTSFDTTPDDIDDFIETVKELCHDS